MVGFGLLVLLGWVILLAILEAWSGERSVVAAGDGRLITNFGLTAMAFGVGALFPIARLGVSGAAYGLNIGLLRSLPWTAIMVAALLAESLSNYWVHRIFHRTPLLWRFHRVHHSDEAVDLSTSFRNHPVELLVALPVSAMLILILGTPPSAVVTTQILFASAAVWQHADISLPPRVDRILGWVIFTPRLHRLHHNPERATHDSNYGELLTVWDRLFGTFNAVEGRLAVGLKDQVAAPDQLLQQLWSPVYSI